MRKSYENILAYAVAPLGFVFGFDVMVQSSDTLLDLVGVTIALGSFFGGAYLTQHQLHNHSGSR